MSVLGVMHLSSVWACCFWYTHFGCQLQKILQGDFRHSPGSPRIRAQHTAGHAASLSLCGLLALLAKSSGVPDWLHAPCDQGRSCWATPGVALVTRIAHESFPNTARHALPLANRACYTVLTFLTSNDPLLSNDQILEGCFYQSNP